MRKSPTTDRDRALRRLRRTTSLSLAAAGTLAAAFAGLAAKALPGRHAAGATTPSTRSTTTRTPTHVRATPPPLVQAQSAAAPSAPAAPAAPSAPAAPAAPPVQTPAPPVAVSGGS